MIYRSWIKQNSPLPVPQSYSDTHWQNFEELRKKYNENICTETNKLVLRLDKLINPEGATTSKQSFKELDKSLVDWTSDDLVKLCPYCAKQFNFARRKHHCRTCGAILCNSCSQFLSYKSACKLVKPAKLYTDHYDRIEEKLNDSRESVDEMPKIRNCEDCIKLLNKRIQTIEDYYCQPVFIEFYEKLRKLMAETDELIISHNELMNQQKEPTPELKDKIQDLKHSIISMSSKLKKMIENEGSGKQAYLLDSIKQSVGYWLKESIESKLRRVQGVNSTSGWVPEQPTNMNFDLEENPLLIQIKNLEEYIKQAKLADRYEEVSALEESKRDLEIEYLLQQDLSLNTNSDDEHHHHQ